MIESYVVDVPDGNTEDETCCFVEALLKCYPNLLPEVSDCCYERIELNI